MTGKRLKYKGQILTYLKTETRLVEYEYTKDAYLEPFFRYNDENFLICQDDNGKIVEVPEKYNIFYSWENADGTFDETSAEQLAKIKLKYPTKK